MGYLGYRVIVFVCYYYYYLFLFSHLEEIVNTMTHGTHMTRGYYK
jgi:hypothetical protein